MRSSSFAASFCTFCRLVWSASDSSASWPIESANTNWSCAALCSALVHPPLGRTLPATPALTLTIPRVADLSGRPFGADRTLYRRTYLDSGHLMTVLSASFSVELLGPDGASVDLCLWLRSCASKFARPRVRSSFVIAAKPSSSSARAGSDARRGAITGKTPFNPHRSGSVQ